MAKWLAKEFDWDTGRYTGRYYDIAEPGIVAVFVDSFYGDDASADPEDPDIPLKTLGAAITYLNTNGADGSRIFMNGIFSENLPAQTYWYEFIGCGGGWNGRVIWFYDLILTTYCLPKSNSRYHNIQTLNFSYQNFFTGGLGTAHYAVNCVLKQTTTSSSTLVLGSGFYFCRLISCRFFTSGNSYIRAFGSVFYNQRRETAGTNNIFGNDNYLLKDPTSPYTVSDLSGTGNINDTFAQFINPSQNDFNVRITSPLLGAGTVDELTGIAANVGGVEVGLPYSGITTELTTEGGATITDLTIDTSGKFTITAPATTGTLETALMDLGNIYPLENIDLFNVFDFAAGEITQGVFETFSSPRMALTIKLKYGLTSAEVDDCPWLLIEYGKQPTFSGIGASRVGNAADTFDPDNFQEITCRYMKLFITLQNNS